MNIKIIRNEQECDSALARIDALMDIERTPEEDEEMQLLTLVISDYEDRNHPIPDADPIAVIEYHVERLGMDVDDVGKLFGSAQRAADVLAGRRPLTLALIRRLSSALDVPPGDLIEGRREHAKKNKTVPRTRHAA